jgi:hypothetical protein
MVMKFILKPFGMNPPPAHSLSVLTSTVSAARAQFPKAVLTYLHLVVIYMLNLEVGLNVALRVDTWFHFDGVLSISLDGASAQTLK